MTAATGTKISAAPGKVTSAVGGVYRPPRSSRRTRSAATSVLHRSCGNAQADCPMRCAPHVVVNIPTIIRASIANSGKMRFTHHDRRIRAGAHPSRARCRGGTLTTIVSLSAIGDGPVPAERRPEQDTPSGETAPVSRSGPPGPPRPDRWRGRSASGWWNPAADRRNLLGRGSPPRSGSDHGRPRTRRYLP